jgi:DNA-binding LacI/PurR family transcriptional regulator
MKKALRTLVSEGLLQRTGLRYRLTRRDSRSFTPTIALIGAGSQAQGVLISERRTETLLESLERECERRGMQVVNEGYDPRARGSLMAVSRRLKAQPGLLGCIVSMWYMGSAEHWKAWCDLLQLLIGLKVPVIALDQGGDLEFPESMLRTAAFRVLRINSFRAGELMGAALLRRGYKHPLFLTLFSDLGWARNRYHGLRHYYEQYGGPDTRVDFITQDAVAEYLDLEWAFMGVDIEDVGVIFRERYDTPGLQDVERRLDRIKKNPPPMTPRTLPARKMIKDYARFLKEWASGEHDPHVFRAMTETLGYLASHTVASVYFEPLFREARARKENDVWVCASDEVMLAALPYLHETSVAIPAELSVVGFDNSYEAFEQQFTTFDFNMADMVREAFRLILDRRELRGQPPVAEVDGVVVERRTTRR